MKKKIYFIISAMVQMISSVYAMFMANDIIKALLDNVSMYPEALQERIYKLYHNSGATIIIMMAIICIILNIFIVYFVCKDKLSEKRKTIIILSICAILTANVVIVELMAIINIIIMVSEKKQDIVISEKKEIPILEQEKVDIVKIVKAIILLLVYFSQMLWKKLLVNNVLGIIVPIVFYVLMIVLCIWFFYDLLRDNLVMFKNNFKAYINYIFTRIGIFYLIYIVVSLACLSISKSFPANQNALEKLPLWLTFPLAVIYAPIVEEILFRGCIRRFIKNNTLFIIISGIIFGLLHTISAEVVLLNAIILAIPYATMGAFLAYIYTKTNNMLSNISCHFFFNFLATIVSILITGI